jgi:tripartite-type tricarboxylate transporter receptor subunit TctC
MGTDMDETMQKEEIMERKHGYIVLVLVVTLLFVTFGGKAIAASSKEAEFFKGKVIDCIVPLKAGGGYDAWIRALSPSLAKNTGATVVIKNVPGAGSLIGTNRMYTSDPNGLTIGILNGPGVMQAQITGIEGVKFDLQKFTWLGRLTAEQRVFAVGRKSKYKTIEAMRQTKERVKYGSMGPGSSGFLEAAILGEALGINIDLISGYEASEEADLALIRGEVDMTAGSFSSKIDMVKNGDLSFIAQFGNAIIPELANVPNLARLSGVSDEGKQLLELVIALGELGRPIVAPPGLSPERSKFLEDALKRSLEDPDFVQLAKKQGMEILYLPPGELKKLVDRGINLPPAIKKKLIDTLAKYQKQSDKVF